MRRDGKFTDSLYKVVVRFGNCFRGDRKIAKRCGLSIFNAQQHMRAVMALLYAGHEVKGGRK